MVGVDAPRIHRVVLVEIEGDDVGEVQSLLAVHPDELAIHPDGRRTGGEAEHRTLPGGALRGDHLRDPSGDYAAELVVVVYHDRTDPLVMGARVSLG